MSKNYMVVSQNYGDRLVFEMTAANCEAFNRLFNSETITQATWHENETAYYKVGKRSYSVEVFSSEEINTRIKNGTAYLKELKEKEEAKAKAIAEEEVSS